jgi:hypothetical protein
VIAQRSHGKNLLIAFPERKRHTKSDQGHMGSIRSGGRSREEGKIKCRAFMGASQVNVKQNEQFRLANWNNFSRLWAFGLLLVSGPGMIW